MVDLDRGGFFRPIYNGYLGPSIGWVRVFTPNSSMPVSAPGTYIADLSSNYIPVNSTAGPVTIILPPAMQPAVGAGAVPGPFTGTPVRVVDVGGQANAHPITIMPQAGETIMGLASIQITANFGGYTLAPNSAAHMWSSISP
jgi:hypothetical protein